MRDNRNAMSLMQRLKSWLLPNQIDGATIAATTSGTAVAGFVQRAQASTDTSSNVPRPLAVLLPAAVAAAAPLRTIPLFLVPSTTGGLLTGGAASMELDPADRTPVPKLHLVYNADTVEFTRAADKRPDAAAFLLAARLASVAHLNTVAGKTPAKKAPRVNASTQSTKAKSQAKSPNRPVAAKAPAIKTAAPKARQCYVRTQTSGKAVVVAVPQRAKRAA
jgi:hypothetical protein